MKYSLVKFFNVCLRLIARLSVERCFTTSGFRRLYSSAISLRLSLLINDQLGIKVKRDLDQYRFSQRGDLIGLDGWLIECKRYANTTANNIHKDAWWSQTCAAALLTGELPVLIYKFDRQPIRCVVYLSAINEAFSNKDDIATISFETWCMLVRESFCD